MRAMKTYISMIKIKNFWDIKDFTDLGNIIGAGITGKRMKIKRRKILY